jgi:hypothetical protein
MFDEPLCEAIALFFQKSRKIVDLGCGDGSYTKYLISKGFDCKGYDGSPLTGQLTDNICGILDLSEKIDIGKYDLVLCLEVGEHIPVIYEQIFIDNICKASNQYIILSWAVEGQPGYGHVNCRNNDYVIDQMKKRNYSHILDNSQYFRGKSTFTWFKNTLMFFEYDYGSFNKLR